MVACTDLDGSAAARVAAELGTDAKSWPLDVTDATATARVIEAVVAACGGLDIVCANAGVSTMNRVVDLTEAEWDHNMAINAKGVFLTDQAAVRHFIGSGTKGVIVNTASLAGKVGAPLLAHYSASKFAVVGFTQALAREVAEHGIRVNCVCPGATETPIIEQIVASIPEHESFRANIVARTPMGRMATPEEVAAAIAYLASDDASHTTGIALPVDGGRSGR